MNNDSNLSPGPVDGRDNEANLSAVPVRKETRDNDDPNLAAVPVRERESNVDSCECRYKSGKRLQPVIHLCELQDHLCFRSIVNVVNIGPGIHQLGYTMKDRIPVRLFESIRDFNRFINPRRVGTDEPVEPQGAGINEPLEAEGSGINDSVEAEEAGINDHVEAEGVSINDRVEAEESDGAGINDRVEAEEADGAGINDRVEAEGTGINDPVEAEGADINEPVETDMESDTDYERDVEMLSIEADPKRMFVPGDLLWVQVGSFPYWPAMVSYDPQTCCFTKVKQGKKRSIRWYHVQYFGRRVQHGWISESSVFLYKGEGMYHKLKFEKYTMASNSVQRKKVFHDFFPAEKIKHEWRVSVDEAEVAFTIIDVGTRYAQFVFKYEMKLSSKHGVGLKNGAESKNGASKRRRKNKDSNKSSKAARIASSVNEDLCRICEKGGVDLKCSGTCFQSFHKECLGICRESENFKCSACETGLPCCFVCFLADAAVVKCNQCNYYFHDNCMEKYVCSNIKKGICAHHACLTCSKSERKKAKSGSFTHCFKCPTAFHASPKCIPVGSVQLTPTLIICPDHFLGKNKVSPQPQVNVSYCVKCGLGGELVCCETCPNSVHASCNETEVPEGDFFCEPCKQQKYLYVGMIVWGKTANYRWWPARVVDPTNVPENIKNVEHFDGEFLIQYFETDEYFWIHRGRVIPYADYHREKDGNKKDSKYTSDFNAALEVAAMSYDLYLDKINNKKCDRKATYQPIVMNRAVPPATVYKDAKASLACNCDPNKPNPCGPDSLCLNRSMLIECNPDLCPAKDNCGNQRINKRQYPKLKLFKTENRGWGLAACDHIPTGTFVIEYVGEVITHDEYRKRFQYMYQNNIENFYFLYLDSQRMIDAGPKGNLARFINHSCDPNCEMEKWSVNGDMKVGIFAIRDIQPGEEVTFNYQSDNFMFQHRCLCGASKCPGYIESSGERISMKSLGKANGKKHMKNNGKKLVKNGENDGDIDEQ